MEFVGDDERFRQGSPRHDVFVSLDEHATHHQRIPFAQANFREYLGSFLPTDSSWR